jgi:pimeloyl-ACP methyl ester carboxylesterase
MVTSNPATFAFVHGAGTGPWIWQRVRDALGLPSLAVEVPSRRNDASPAGCAAEIVRQLDEADVGDVVLVLHSLAGVLAAPLAARLGPRLRSTILVSAVIPAPGKRFVDAVGFPGSLILKLLFRFNPQGLKPSAKMLRGELCNDLTETDATDLVNRYEPEWPGLYLGRVEAAGPLPSPIYIRLTNDRSISPARQDRMIAQIPEARVVEFDAGHMAMLSRPRELAQLLTNVSGWD